MTDTAANTIHWTYETEDDDANIKFVYSDNYEGYVLIERAGDDVEVPFEALKALVAGYVRDRQIIELEECSDDEALGVTA